MLKSKYKIVTSARGNSLRIAPHFYNTYNEVEMLLRPLKIIFNDVNLRTKLMKLYNKSGKFLKTM